MVFKSGELEKFIELCYKKDDYWDNPNITLRYQVEVEIEKFDLEKAKEISESLTINKNITEIQL